MHGYHNVAYAYTVYMEFSALRFYICGCGKNEKACKWTRGLPYVWMWLAIGPAVANGCT